MSQSTQGPDSTYASQGFSESLFPMGGSRRPVAAPRGAVGRAMAPVSRWLASLNPRERLLVLAGGTAVLLLLLWMLALRPAWRTATQVPAQRQALSVQMLLMQQLAAEARDLRALPTIAPAQAAQVLQSATQRLGAKARLTSQGDRTVVTFTEISPEQWRGWLSEVRSGARARPVDAQLSVGPTGLSGTVTLSAGGTP